MSAGIDYGRGQVNIDKTTGIRYGVISQHTVGQAWYEDVEPDYGPPTCPKCGNEVSEFNSDDGDSEDYEGYNSRGCADYTCHQCKHTLDSQYVTPDEPRGWNYSGEGYELVDCLDSDIMVLKSPYYTFAQYCSPCVPGAGNLNNPCEEGAKSYCLGYEWFEEGKAPYPVYSVDTGAEVLGKSE